MMRDWSKLRVLILGAARQGLALGRFLARQGAQVTLNDQRSAEQMQPAVQALQGLPVKLVFGGHPVELLDDADLLCISGGIPLNLPIIGAALRREIPISNDSQVFMEAVACPVIGITGSAGKTTTTTLVSRMAEAFYTGQNRSWVGGNIGRPLIEYFEEIKEKDLVILELSSFQLEQMTISPQVAAILNITPNHLDRHGTMEAYTAAKAQIIAHQSKTDTAVLGHDDPGAWSLAGLVRGRLVSFGFSQPPEGTDGAYLDGENICLYKDGKRSDLMPLSMIELRGSHNIANVLAACAIADCAGISHAAIQAGVRGFTGVAHRLELVRVVGEVAWFNDSIATAPERTIAAIQTFKEPIVLLLGGRDKNLPWETLAGLVRARVDHVIAFGEAREKIIRAINAQPGDRPFSLTTVQNLQDAVQAAAHVARPGDVVLLSPGGTSFDEFRDFEERGEQFRKWVNSL